MFKFKIGDRVRLTADVPIMGRFETVCTIQKGAIGTVHNAVHSRIGLWAVLLDANGHAVLIDGTNMEHIDGEIALLRAQLAARDAALDAVLALALKQRDGGDMDLERAGDDMCNLLLKHGVHPKNAAPVALPEVVVKTIRGETNKATCAGAFIARRAFVCEGEKWFVDGYDVAPNGVMTATLKRVNV